MGSLQQVQGRSTADRIRSKSFPVAMRGYDRAAVEAWLEEIAELVERLEERPPTRDTAVKRALDEIGQETAAILQRAHAAAEEIEARSRAQADGRLQRAEREAEQVLGEAEEQATRLEADTRRIWAERTRLLEEMRRFADEVLRVADDAVDRLRPPGREPEHAEEPPAFEAVTDLREELEVADGEQPTVEVEVSRLGPEPDTEEVAEPGEQLGSGPDDEADAEPNGPPESKSDAGAATDRTRA
jgi:cell division initiation protein